MKRFIIILLLAAVGIASLTGCSIVDQVKRDVASELNEALSEAQADLDDAKKDVASGLKEADSAIGEALSDLGVSSSATESVGSAGKTYTMADIDKLENTGNFTESAIDHIFDGTINKKGEATGYHYNMVSDSMGSTIAGTESEPDRHGVFTAKVKVSGVKKNGFSSFFPSDWSPQEVVDAINHAYDDALSDESNPHNSLWIGYADDLEIDMYLNDQQKIITAYPIYEED